MSDSRERSKAIGMLILATPCWALSFPVMKALELEQQRLLPGADTWFLTALGVMIRFGISGLLMLPFVIRTGRFTRREIEQGLLLALFGGGGIAFQMDGLSYTMASTSAFLTQGYIVFIPLWLILTTGRWPSPKIFSCITLMVLGMAVLVNLNIHSLKLGRGEWETIIASLSFTGQILCLEHPRYAGNRPVHFSAVMFLMMALLCVPLIVVTAPGVDACWRAFASPAATGLMAILILVCSLAGYLIMNYWQKKVTATEAGLIYCIEPVCASALALFLPGWFSAWSGVNYPNETLTDHLLIGGALVTGANVLLQVKNRDA